ncbi:MAG: hypothetical protein QOF51_210 [Chloroflexota bacterium]|jgi:HEAT repeat protein|nr:hypothetical protein [Chloroflexota bacterium]
MYEEDPLDAVEAALRTGLDLSDAQVRALAGLEGAGLTRFQTIWRDLTPEQSVALLQQLGEAAEENLVLDFAPIFALTLDDPAADVRELGFRLAAAEPVPELLDTYLRAAVTDPDTEVRLAAVEGLGGFTLLAQTEDWPRVLQDRLETALVGLLHLPGTDLEFRRAALLSLAYLATDRTEAEIRQADLQPGLHDTAIRAMGRNCQEIWIPDIAAALEEDDLDLQIAAAEASGELEDERLVPSLIRLINGDEPDVQVAAIEALGLIGGSEAKEALTDLLSARDRTLRDAARHALDVLLADEDPFRGAQ